jgi:hypothetical protein
MTTWGAHANTMYKEDPPYVAETANGNGNGHTAEVAGESKNAD